MDSTPVTGNKDQLRLTVAICTYDRPYDLELCLTSLGDQSAGEGLYEVVVVDNGPTQATEAMAERFALSGVPVRYVVEPRRGTTYARRTAWQVAQGEFVGYVDDDAVVCQERSAECYGPRGRTPQQPALFIRPVKAKRALPRVESTRLSRQSLGVTATG